MKKPADPAAEATTSIAFVLIPRFNMMALTATIEPLRVANYITPKTLYDWVYLSADGGAVTASNGMSLATTAVAEAKRPMGMIFIFGSWGCEHYHRPKLLSWLRRMERSGIVLASMELGLYILARAGLLSGRLATTHWSCMAGFAEQFPSVLMREQLFTIDRKILTCAGGTAGLDLMLHQISQQHGQQLASEVADQIMHYPVRPAEAGQRQTLGGLKAEIHSHVKAAIAVMERNIEEPLTVPEIAAEVGISQRQLERLFRRFMGCSAVQFNQLLRLQYARVLLTSTRLSIREVSAACGFNSMSYFSQAFSRCFEKRPSDYRQAWPEGEPAPAWPGTVFSFIERSRKTAPRG